MTEEYLRDRILKHGKTQATKFFTDTKLAQTLPKVLQGNQAEIAAWMKTAKVGDTMDFVLKAADQGENLGMGYFRNASGAAERIMRPLKGARLILKKTGDDKLTPFSFHPE